MADGRSWIREHVLEAPRRRSLLWCFVATSLFFGGAMGTFLSALVMPPELPATSRVAAGVVIGLFSGLSFGASMTVFIAWTWSQHGGADQATRIARAVKTGRLPDGVDTSTWDPILARQETWARRGAWLFTLEFAVFAALSASLLALPPDPADTLTPTWLFWIGLVMFGVLTVVTPFSSLHRARRIVALRAQLRDAGRAPVAPVAP